MSELKRSSNRILAGVCGGIAQRMDIDPTIVRAVYAAITIFSAAFPGIILYIILWIVMPE